MRTHPRRVLVLALWGGLGFLAYGCSEDRPTDPDPVFAISKAPVSDGDSQLGTTGHTLLAPLRVLVTKDGEPVGAQGVEWVADSGQGVMSPGASVTSVDGIATTRWTLGTTAREYQAQARLPGQTTATVTFTATALPNFPDEIVMVSGDNQSTPVTTQLPEPLVVVVGDQFDNPFPGAVVEWLILSGDAQLGAVTTITDLSGQAHATIVMGSTPGPVQVQVRYPGALSGPNVIFQATATP